MKNLSLKTPVLAIMSVCILFLFPSFGYSQLSGDILIGSGETYTTLSDAVNALNSSGFTGHVRFLIKDGTYNEQVEVNEFANSDENNTITFTSQSGDSTSVILAYESGSENNYIIRLNGTDYITIEKITLWGVGNQYTHAIDITGTAQNISIQNCELRSNAPVIAGTQNPALIHHDRANITDVTVSNNYLVGGFGVYFESHFSAPTQGVKILSNTFEDGNGGIYLEYQNDAVIDRNIMINKDRTGCKLVNCEGEIEITNNKIEVLQSWALSLTYCDGGTPPLSEPGLIANNFLTANGPDASDAKGIVLNGCTNQEIFHNSVNIIGRSTIYAQALYLSGGNNNVIKNNIFANQHDGYACYVASPGQGTEIDYNNYYSPANFPYYWNERKYSFEEFKAASGMDTHSQEAYPNYTSDFDLHTMAPWLNNRGEYISKVFEDLDGNARSNPPDFGACEFIPAPGTTSPLNGMYSIGSNPYLTFQDAVSDLVLKGISGPVVFNIADGQYNEQLIIRDIPGASDQNTITMQSVSGDPNNVVLYYHDAGIQDNYVVLMKGADYWRFKNITFRSNTSPVATYGRVFHLFGGTDDLMVDNCLFLGSPVNNSAVDALAVVYSNKSVFKSRRFENSLFQHGSYGYFDKGLHSLPLLKGLELHNNEFREAQYGIFVDYAEAPKITGNVIHETGYSGIHVGHASGKIEVLANIVSVDQISALYLESCDGLADRGIVANNFLHAGGTNTAHGMRVYNTNNFDFYYNSVSVTSNDGLYGRALYLTTAQNLNFLNNIFSNTGGGFVYYIDTPSAFNSSDYNDLYTTGAILAKWNGDQANLAALQTESGMETNSISVDPQFVSADDLHTSAAALDAAGTPVAGITDDIDGHPRHPLTPDIGADEFMTGPNNPPTVIAPIADVDYPEDSGPKTVTADLNTVFSDPDPGDFLIFTAASDNQAIAPVINSAELSVQSQTNYFGSAMIVVTATDLVGNAVRDTFQVTFTPVNDPPIAVDDAVSSGANHAFTIHVLQNDYDVDGDAISITSQTQGQNGSTQIDPGDTTITYTPQNGFFGADTFTYDISDGNGGTDQAKVFVTITNLFEAVQTDLIQLSHAACTWVDYDMDGDLDICLAGLDQSSNSVLRIYRNNTGTFALVSNLPGISPGNPNAMDWGDFDNDGDPDLLITGYTAGSTRSTKLYRNDINTFPEVTAGIEGISDGSVDWGDYDNDGDPDILLSGLNVAGNEITKVYANLGAGPGNNWVFVGLGNVTLPGVQKGIAVWGDYDNDSDMDILISGQGAGRILRVYRNDAGAFTDAGAGLAAVAGVADWGDYDNDGDLDILVNGTNASLDGQCDIYQNSNGSFTNINAGIPGLKNGSACWGDYDNDGDLDICLSGTNADNEPACAVYDNLGANTFSEASLSLPGIVFSTANWGDYDNDSRLDLLLAGYQYTEPNVTTALYKNAIPTTNDAPNPPQLLAPEVAETSVTLHWSRASDNQTSAAGISYNLRVGEVPGGSHVVSAMSNATGYRQVVHIGNANMDTSWTVAGLTAGRLYHWSVQAIDGAFAGSPFASGTFSTISPYVEEVVSGFPGLMHGTVDWGDYDGDGDLDIVMAGEVDGMESSRKTGIYTNELGVFSETDHDLPDLSRATLKWGDYDNDGDLDLFAAGDPGIQTKIVAVYQNNDGNFTDIQADFSTLNDRLVYDADWGDYDNDGDLDLVICGHDNNPVTKLFQNNAGVFSEVNLNVSSGTHATVSWVDYDTDGDLDLFINGNSVNLYKNNSGAFTNSNISLIGTSYGSIDWGDYDSDGDPDLLLTGIGIAGEAMVPMTKLYRNDVSDNGTFSDMNSDIQDITYGRAAWGDFDNDGDLDILIAGNSEFGVSNQPFSAIYMNDDLTFTPLDMYLPPLMTAHVSWADYDNDQDLDFLLTGVDAYLNYCSKLFKNKNQTPNSLPNTPTGLIAEASENELIFHWHPSSDDETASNSLSYNLRIGTSPGGSEIKSAMSDTSGYRQIVQSGNAGMDTTWSLTNFDPGIFYYWSVQSVDNNFSGSGFANEHSFYSIPELEAVLVVTNNNDSGEGSLRQAIFDANALAGLDTIVFAANVRGTIELESPLPHFSEAVKILGPGPNLLTIDANQTGWVLKSMPGIASKLIHLSGLRFTGGLQAAPGAGIYASGDSLVISECIFDNNVSTNAEHGGGAICNINGGSTVIYNSSINQNSATKDGGGIYALGGRLFIMGSTISNNIVETETSHGGGINTTAETELINSTITGNQNPGFGGGIYCNNNSLELKHVTITQNQAKMGGGVYGYISASMEATHAIIAGNSAETSSPDIAGSLNSKGYNLIQNTEGCLISGDLAGNIHNQDALLENLALNGGLTKTHALLTGSPAIDGGRPGACIPNDQCGTSRPQDGDGDSSFVCDIGAVESMKDADDDGLPDFEEYGPDGDDIFYDGNDDGSPDYEQDDVSSFFNFDRSTYITLVDLSGYPLRGVRVIEYPDEDGDDSNQDPFCWPTPGGGWWCGPWGWYGYGISSRSKTKEKAHLPELDALSTQCRIFMPAGEAPDFYLMYGPTPKIPYDHFYDFAYDGKTGAVFHGDTITLHFIDGQRGDGDLTVNGEINVSYGSYGYSVTNICGNEQSIPVKFALLPNYPNPFNPITTIPFDLPVACAVELEVYNVLGQKVVTLINEHYPAGRHLRTWNIQNLSSGIYFYRLKAGNYVQTRKLVILR